MYEFDAAVTHAINGLAGRITAVYSLMIWISAIGVPLLVLAVAIQWWRRTDRPPTRHVLVAARVLLPSGPCPQSDHLALRSPDAPL